MPAAIFDQTALSVVADDHLQSGYLYHTIRHTLSRRYNLPPLVIWNLPVSYRPPTNKQRDDITDWIKELQGQNVVLQPELGLPLHLRFQMSIWEGVQILLLLLDEGQTI